MSGLRVARQGLARIRGAGLTAEIGCCEFDRHAVRRAVGGVVPGLAVAMQRLCGGDALGGNQMFQRRQPVAVIGLAGVRIAGGLGALDLIGEGGSPLGPAEQAAFVQGLYEDFLGRTAGAEEQAAWARLMDGGLSRAEVAAGFCGSAEAQEHLKGATTGVFVADVEGSSARGLYKCALGREGEAGGVKYWANVIEQGTNIKALGDGFDDTPEFVARHGGSTNREYVEKLYQDGLCRAADAGGLDYWTKLLDSGQLGRGELAVIYATTVEVRGDLEWLL